MPLRYTEVTGDVVLNSERVKETENIVRLGVSGECHSIVFVF